MTVPILNEQVERNILLIRRHRVILDIDLAKLCGVPTKVEVEDNIGPKRSQNKAWLCSQALCIARAIQVNIAIMRTFVQLREMICSNKGLSRQLNELEKKYDSQFRVVFEARWEGKRAWKEIARPLAWSLCSQSPHDETVVARCAQWRLH